MTDWRTVPDDELDARLSADLRELADDAVEPDRWSRWQLWSAVRGRIEPRPTRQSRSPLVSLAATGALGILLVLLVVSAPAFVPGGSTPKPDETPPSSWSGLNTREFSAAVAAGELRGQTWLVSGQLTELMVSCSAGPCPNLHLVGSDPPLDLVSRPLPVTADTTGAFDAEIEGVDWSWWEFPGEPPMGALLVLSVDSAGVVEYLGWQSDEPLGVSSFAHVDPASMSQSEVHVVPGWLTAFANPRADPLPGPPDPISGLPQRRFVPWSWLVDRPLRFEPSSYSQPEGGVQVQSSAYEAFTGALPSTTPEPVPGLWAVAPRLEGAGCPEDVVPCWRWNLVGRVTYEEADNVAEPMPSSEPSDYLTPAPGWETPEPTDALVSCWWASSIPMGTSPIPRTWSASVADATGSVDDCILGGRFDDHPQGSAISVSNGDDGDSRALSVVWIGDACNPKASVSISLSADGYSLVVTEHPVAGGPICQSSMDERSMLLVLTEPIAAPDVTASLRTDGEPVPARTPSPQPAAVTHECSGPPLPPGETPAPDSMPTVIDYTGLVTTCLVSDWIVTELDGSISVGNLAGGVNGVQVVWAEGRCDGAIVFTLDRSSDGYLLSGDRPETCAFDGGAALLDIRLREPVSAEDIHPTLDQEPIEPSPTPSPAFLCPRDDGTDEEEVTLLDHAAVVLACRSEVGGDIDVDVRAANPGGDLRRVLIEWQVPALCGSMPRAINVWRLNEEAGGGLFVAVERLRPEAPVPCDGVTGSQSVELELSEEAEARPVGEGDDVFVGVMDDGHASVTADTTVGDFELTLRTAKLEYAEGEPIDVVSILTYRGPNDPQRLAGLTMAYGYTQLDGELEASFGYTGECIASTIRPEEPIVEVADNSLGIFNGDFDSPLSREWRESDYLWLPPGMWRVDIFVVFGIRGRDDLACPDEYVTLNPSVVIEVLPDSEPSVVALRTAPPNPSNECPGAEVGGTLVPHPESGIGLRDANGEVSAVMWPHGYTGQQGGDGVVLHGPDGSVVAREGDYVIAGGGGAGEYEYACFGVEVARPVDLSTASEPCSLTALQSGYLVEHPTSGLGIRSGTQTYPVTWPPGYSARREYGAVVLVWPDGLVTADDGDQVYFGGFTDDTGAVACGQVNFGPAP